MTKEQCGKMHEIIGDQILVNQALREGIQEYWLEHGISHVLPDESMATAKKESPKKAEKKLVPWAEGTWRLLGPDECIKVGDQWAPLSAPDRWRPINDSVGKKVSDYRKSRFRRLTIEVDIEDICQPGRDTGRNLVGTNCWLWSDGDMEPRMGRVTGYDRESGLYTALGARFEHAQPGYMSEPELRPRHPFRNAGAALIRCKCLLWGRESVNFDPSRATIGIVKSFDGTTYVAKNGDRYVNAQPIGETPEPLPPMLLQPVYGEIPGLTGEALIGRRCYVWNESPFARPRRMSEAIIATVTAFNDSERFCYLTDNNVHVFARPVEFGHPDRAQRDPALGLLGEYCRLTQPDGSHKFGVITDICAITGAMYCGSEVFERDSEVVVADIPSDLSGKRAIVWDRRRVDSRSEIIGSHREGVARTTRGVVDRAFFDVCNQDPDEDSGEKMVGIECYVWDERFSASRTGTISEFSEDLYVTTINGETRRFKHARPVSLGVR